MAYEQFRYTIQLNLLGQQCIVVGGGNVALRKTKSLLSAGASVTVIAPMILPAIVALQRSVPALSLYRREFQAGDIKDAFLVIAATDSRKVNEMVAQEANRNHVLLNVADDPEAGNFSVAGTWDSGNLHFSVATGGNPRFTHLLLEDLQQQYGGDMATFCTFLDEQRARVKRFMPGASLRQDFWRNTLTLQLLQMVKDGHLQEAKEIIINAVDRIRSQS